MQSRRRRANTKPVSSSSSSFNTNHSNSNTDTSTSSRSSHSRGPTLPIHLATCRSLTRARSNLSNRRPEVTERADLTANNSKQATTSISHLRALDSATSIGLAQSIRRRSMFILCPLIIIVRRRFRPPFCSDNRRALTCHSNNNSSTLFQPLDKPIKAKVLSQLATHRQAQVCQLQYNYGVA